MEVIVLSAVTSAILAALFTALLMRGRRAPLPVAARAAPLRVVPRVLRPPMPRVTRTRPMWGRPAPRLSVTVPPVPESDREAELADMRTALDGFTLDENFEVETRLLIRV